MRVNEIRCDRCGKRLDKYVSLSAITVAPPVYRAEWAYELCILCWGKIQRLIREGDPEDVTGQKAGLNGDN